MLTAGPISRSGLAARLGLSPSTVTRLLPPLLEADYIREEAGPNRPRDPAVRSGCSASTSNATSPSA